jgi:PAS domain S-box-containing protein
VKAYPTKILLAEDEPAHAEAIRRAFLPARGPVDLSVVPSAEAFRLAAEANPPDMALIDLLLPDGRADALLTSPPEAAPFPIIVITSHGDETVAVRAIKAGAIDYIVKSPQAFADLPRTIERVWREWTLRRERHESAVLQGLTSEVLSILNDPGSVEDASQRILRSIRQATGMDAVGIRIKDGADYPYAAADGFSRAFLASENSLLPPQLDRQTCRDEHGNISLECTCGLVLMGRTDGSNPLYSPGGSAWTNDTLPLLGARSDADSRLNPRNRCIHDGYRSVALIPIRMGTNIVGLLQMNDRRPDRFGETTIGFFEGLAANFGVALGRKLRLEAIRQNEERYRQLLETSFDWIWEVDATGRYTFASDRVRDLLGYTPDEIIGRTPYELMPAEEAERVRRIFEPIAATREKLAALENVCVRRDGQHVVVETSGVPIIGPDGEYRGYRGMDRDITRHKQLEAQLRQSQKLEAIGQLAGGVAHDFNNILAATMMHIGLLQANPEFNDDTRRALKELETEAQRAASLTRQLLMFSRRSVLSRKHLDLNEVVANLIRMLRRLIGEHIDLRFDARSALPPVDADAGMLEQVIMNLVVNARDAMPKGGRITLATAVTDLTEADTLGQAARRPGRFVCLSVDDTGTGMDSETVARVFEPFFTTKEAGQGTGLGLATVHGIVAQHQGWVEVESWPGVGSTFRVLLPAADHAAVEAEAALRLDAAPIERGRETILLVEDEAGLRRTLARSLTELGYHIIEAGNGQEAMALWKRHGRDVDLLFTDVVMPEGMTGLELAERLRAMRPGLKSVISSGYSAEAVQGGRLAAPDLVYLPKPYEIRQLAKVIRDTLNHA